MKTLKKLICLMLVLALAAGLVPFAIADDIKDASDYDDADDITCVEAVDVTTGLGIFVGEGGSFLPDRDLRRCEAVVLLARFALGAAKAALLPKGTTGFRDVDGVSGYDFAIGAITWAVSEGYVVGYGNGLFGPGDPVTATEFAVMLLRVLQYGGNNRYEGQGWQTRAMLDAMDTSDGVAIFGSINGIDFTDAVIRDFIAQMILNALQRRFKLADDKFSADTIGWMIHKLAKETPNADPFGFPFYQWVANGDPVSQEYKRLDMIKLEGYSDDDGPTFKDVSKLKWAATPLSLWINGAHEDDVDYDDFLTGGADDEIVFKPGLEYYFLDTKGNGNIDRVIVIFELLGIVTGVDEEEIEFDVYDPEGVDKATSATFECEGFEEDDYVLLIPFGIIPTDPEDSAVFAANDHALEKSKDYDLDEDPLSIIAAKSETVLVTGFVQVADGDPVTSISAGDKTYAAFAAGLGLGFSTTPSFEEDTYLFFDSNDGIIGYGGEPGEGAPSTDPKDLDYVYVLSSESVEGIMAAGSVWQKAFANVDVIFTDGKADTLALPITKDLKSATIYKADGTKEDIPLKTGTPGPIPTLDIGWYSYVIDGDEILLKKVNTAFARFQASPESLELTHDSGFLFKGIDGEIDDGTGTSTMIDNEFEARANASSVYSVAKDGSATVYTGFVNFPLFSATGANKTVKNVYSADGKSDIQILIVYEKAYTDAATDVIARVYVIEMKETDGNTSPDLYVISAVGNVVSGGRNYTLLSKNGSETMLLVNTSGLAVDNVVSLTTAADGKVTAKVEDALGEGEVLDYSASYLEFMNTVPVTAIVAWGNITADTVIAKAGKAATITSSTGDVTVYGWEKDGDDIAVIIIH